MQVNVVKILHSCSITWSKLPLILPVKGMWNTVLSIAAKTETEVGKQLQNFVLGWTTCKEGVMEGIAGDNKLITGMWNKHLQTLYVTKVLNSVYTFLDQQVGPRGRDKGHIKLQSFLSVKPESETVIELTGEGKSFKSNSNGDMSPHIEWKIGLYCMSSPVILARYWSSCWYK